MPTNLAAFENPGAGDKIVKKVENGIGDLKLAGLTRCDYARLRELMARVSLTLLLPWYLSVPEVVNAESIFAEV